VITGTWPLLRLAMRRDRWLIIGWLAALVLTTASSAKATIDLYGDPVAGQAAAHAVNTNPALVAMYGPIFDERAMGALAIFKLLLLFGALMTTLFVVIVRRHTRLEEESGRAELVAATGTGELAPLAAAVLQGSGLAVLLGVLVALGNIAAGLPATGSWSFGLGWAGLALVAVALTAVAAQVFSSSRSVSGAVAAALGAFYFVRAIGDITKTDAFVWASPFGWLSRMRPYADERWLPFGLLILLWAVGTAIAFALRARRDLGSGLVAARPGPATGRMGSVVGLVSRLHRPGLIGWTLGLVALGAILGGIAPSAADFAGTQEVQDMLRRMGGSGLLKDAFLAIETSFMGVAAAAYAISVVARPATEESAGRTEVVLATGTSRTGVYLTAVGYAMAAAAVLLAAFGLSAGVAFGRAEDDLGQIPRLAAAALGQLPAVWVLVAISALAFGLRAAWAPIGWVLLVAAVVVGHIGELLNLPKWLVKSSPFAHVPRMPVEEFRFDGGVLSLLVITIVMTFAGLIAYRRRDIASG